MSDDMMMSSEEPIVPEGTVAPLPAPPIIKPGMARRNVLLIVAGVIVLVALVGFIAYALILVGSANAPTGQPVVTPGAPGSTTPSSTTTATLLPVPDVENRDVFTPRNPFEVIPGVALKVKKAEAASTDGTSTPHVAELSLVSVDVTTDPANPTAIVKLDGVTQPAVHQGDSVGGYLIEEILADSISGTDPNGNPFGLQLP